MQHVVNIKHPYQFTRKNLRHVFLLDLMLPFHTLNRKMPNTVHVADLQSGNLIWFAYDYFQIIVTSYMMGRQLGYALKGAFYLLCYWNRKVYSMEEINTVLCTDQYVFQRWKMQDICKVACTEQSVVWIKSKTWNNVTLLR